MDLGKAFLHSLIGAVVTVFTSFLPLSPVIGGAVGAYLQEGNAGESIRVGALAGLLAAVPLVVFLVSLGGILPFLPGLGMPGGAAALFGTFFVIALLFMLIYTVGLSTLGGYLGWYIRTQTDL